MLSLKAKLWCIYIGKYIFHTSNVVQQTHGWEKRLKKFILVSCLLETKKTNELLT